MFKWNGAAAILLDEYLRNKEELYKLKSQKQYLLHHGADTKDIDEKIKYVEKDIVEFINERSREGLKSLIYMSLDMNVDIKKDLPDELKTSSNF